MRLLNKLSQRESIQEFCKYKFSSKKNGKWGGLALEEIVF